jgi:predicted AAA+ superfamily ATPase
MLRFAAKEFENWLKNNNRKPMVLRGARQVGKTWLVRDFANRQKLQLVELNFERFPGLAGLFSENEKDPLIS